MRPILETIEEGREEEQENLGGGDFYLLLQNRQNVIPKTGNTMVTVVGVTMDEGQEEEKVRKTCGC